MTWLVLVASGIVEAVWATALSRSDGFSRLLPSLIFFVALTLSMSGLAFAMRSLPTGTSYAVWVGVGAVLTVGYAILTGDESSSPVKLMLKLLPGMRERQFGHIVNVSSIGVQTRVPRFGAYIASKAALDILCDAWQAETHSDDVRFSTVHMSLVRTPMI